MKLESSTRPPASGGARIDQTGRSPVPSPEPWDIVRFLPVMLAAFSAGAAGIHGSVIDEHARQYWLFAAFFALIAGAQLAWALVVLTRPTRTIYWAAAVGNAAIVIVWIVSRTVGVPLGPDAGKIEGLGFQDVVATSLEIAIVVGCALLLVPRVLDAQRCRRGPFIVAVLASLAAGALVAAAMAMGSSSESVARATGPSAEGPLLPTHWVHLLLMVTVAGAYVAHRGLVRLKEHLAEGIPFSVSRTLPGIHARRAIVSDPHADRGSR